MEFHFESVYICCQLCRRNGDQQQRDGEQAFQLHLGTTLG